MKKIFSATDFGLVRPYRSEMPNKEISIEEAALVANAKTTHMQDALCIMREFVRLVAKNSQFGNWIEANKVLSRVEEILNSSGSLLREEK